MIKKNVSLVSLGVLCILSVIIFLFNSKNTYEAENYIKIISEASLNLNKINRDSNETFFIQKNLNHLYGLLSEEKYSLEKLENVVSNFNNNIKGIKLRLFDKNLKPIELKNNNKNDSVNSAMNRLFLALASDKQKNDYSLLKRYKSLFETLLGAVDLEVLSKDSSVLLPVTLSGKPGYIYWNYYEDNKLNDISGIIAWIRKDDISLTSLKQNIIDDYNNKNVKTGCFYGFVKQGGDIYPQKVNDIGFNYDYNEIILKIQELKACMKNYDFIGNYLFYFIPNGNNQYYFCFIKGYNSNILWISFSFVCFFIIFFSTWNFKIFFNFIEKLKTNTSLEKELRKIYFIGYSFILLVLVLFLLVNAIVYKIEKEYKKELVFSTLRSSLECFNDGYIEAKTELAEKLKAITLKEEFKNLDYNILDNYVKDLNKQHVLDKIFITNKKGNILYSYPQNKDSLLNKIIPIVASKIASERFGTEDSWQEKINDMMLNSVSQSFSDLLGDGANKFLKSFENYDSVSQIELGSKRHLVFSTLINSPKPLICIIWIDDEYFSKNYLINKIKDNQSLPENLKKFELGIVPCRLDSNPYPKEIAKYSFSRDITEQVPFYNRSISFETNAGGQNIYGVGTRLNSIPNYVLFAFQQE